MDTAVFREIVVCNTEQNPPATNYDGVVHRCARGARSRREHDDDDSKGIPKDGDDRDGDALGKGIRGMSVV